MENQNNLTRKDISLSKIQLSIKVFWWRFLFVFLEFITIFFSPILFDNRIFYPVFILLAIVTSYYVVVGLIEVANLFKVKHLAEVIKVTFIVNTILVSFHAIEIALQIQSNSIPHTIYLILSFVNAIGLISYGFYLGNLPDPFKKISKKIRFSVIFCYLIYFLCLIITTSSKNQNSHIFLLIRIFSDKK